MPAKINTPAQVADVIERFLSGFELYPQEFNDFVECSLPDPTLDEYRRRCEMLHTELELGTSHLTLLSLEHRQPGREAAAIEGLRRIVRELRSRPPAAKSSNEQKASPSR